MQLVEGVAAENGVFDVVGLEEVEAAGGDAVARRSGHGGWRREGWVEEGEKCAGEHGFVLVVVLEGGLGLV